MYVTRTGQKRWLHYWPLLPTFANEAVLRRLHTTGSGCRANGLCYFHLLFTLLLLPPMDKPTNNKSFNRHVPTIYLLISIAIVAITLIRREDAQTEELDPTLVSQIDTTETLGDIINQRAAARRASMADSSTAASRQSATNRAGTTAGQGSKTTAPTSKRQPTPLEEGYWNGVEAGWYDGQGGHHRGTNYDSSCSYIYRNLQEYRRGYETGYEYGYNQGYAEYKARGCKPPRI